MNDLNWFSIFATGIIGGLFAAIFGFIGLFINNRLNFIITKIQTTEVDLETANKNEILEAIANVKKTVDGNETLLKKVINNQNSLISELREAKVVSNTEAIPH
jgi:hypothetical protein